MSQYALDAWIRSGMAATAARELAWFVVLVFIGIGYVIWRDSKKK